MSTTYIELRIKSCQMNFCLFAMYSPSKPLLAFPFIFLRHAHAICEALMLCYAMCRPAVRLERGLVCYQAAHSLSPQNTNDCIFIFGNPFFLDCRRLSLMSAVIAKYAFRETEMEVRCEM
jgi:hypothetical protein